MDDTTTTPNRYCTECGQANPATGRFCLACGKALAVVNLETTQTQALTSSNRGSQPASATSAFSEQGLVSRAKTFVRSQPEISIVCAALIGVLVLALVFRTQDGGPGCNKSKALGVLRTLVDKPPGLEWGGFEQYRQGLKIIDIDYVTIPERKDICAVAVEIQSPSGFKFKWAFGYTLVKTSSGEVTPLLEFRQRFDNEVDLDKDIRQFASKFDKSTVVPAK